MFGGRTKSGQIGKAMMNFKRNFLRNISNQPAGQELGFGRTMTTTGRMMNPDGSFNVVRQRVSLWDNVYYHLMTMSWRRFIALVILSFLFVNVTFASLYLALGIEHLDGVKPGTFWHNFSQAYFFSSQTLTTVGYGHIAPNTLSSNFLASIESFAGLLTFALISGLLYGRFSRPRARVVFSEKMLVAPYKNGEALMFRVGNARKSELIEAEVRFFVAINQVDELGEIGRRYFPLNLEVAQISFFTLSWTLVHALTDTSPLWGFSLSDFQDANAEFMILVKGTDEANHQSVHARRSYVADEIVWKARFKPAITRDKQGRPFVLNREIGAYEVMNDE